MRERGAEDIQAIANYFLKKHNPALKFAPDAIAKLISYSWPGNVRELENTIQRALHVCNSKKITTKDLGLMNQSMVHQHGSQGTLLQMEQKLISDTLNKTKSNMAETARRLGISRATLYRKVKQYEVETD